MNDTIVRNCGTASQVASEMPMPPGFAATLSTCLLNSSYSPVIEVAITATLAVLAGVAGRAYRTHTDKDLALYIILVARSGIGKDAIHEGIPKLIEMADVRGADRFVRQENFVSGPALHRSLLIEPGFLNLQGEFGRKMKRMANPTDTPMQELRTLMTNAYAKKFLEGKTHANPENCLPGVSCPALSFLGETTPSTFLETLTPDMMEDGFLSRFLTITYNGGKPPPQHERAFFLKPHDLSHWRALLAQVVSYQGSINIPPPRHVGFLNDDARERLDRFEMQCNDELNATEDEFERQLLSRAPLKVMKVAGLLAVADDFDRPKLDLGHVVWGITLVRADMAAFRARQASGEVGDSDHNRELIILKLLRDLVIQGPGKFKMPYGVDASNRWSVVPRHYIQTRTANIAAFKKHRLGGTAAMDQTLKSLVHNGFIAVLDRKTAAESHRTLAQCYRILSPVLDA